MLDWSKYRNFTEAEFRCSCGCGRAEMREEFMDRLQAIRTVYGKPMTPTSGYRCPNHEEERKKTHPGSHAQGRAVDIAFTSSEDQYRLVQIAMDHGMVGIGIAGSFTHLDDGHEHKPRPGMWRYRS